MASKLKNRHRAQIEQNLVAEKSSEPEQSSDPRSSSGKEDGDDFPTTPNIAAKIAQRRLPRRTPTSHVKGVTAELMRRRLSKTSEEEPGRNNNITSRFTFKTSIDESKEEPSGNIAGRLPPKTPYKSSIAGKSPINTSKPL